MDDGVQSNKEIGKWLSTFQKKVNIVTGYKGLVFTVHSLRLERERQ
jgi:hypothetical protein